MAWYGKAFLEASIGPVLRRLVADKVAIEVDPMRSGKGTRDVEKNVELLIHWCHEFWNQIYSVRAECPKYVRLLNYSPHQSYLSSAKCARSLKPFVNLSSSGTDRVQHLPTTIIIYHGKVSRPFVSSDSLFPLSYIHTCLDFAQVFPYKRRGNSVTDRFFFTQAFPACQCSEV